MLDLGLPLMDGLSVPAGGVRGDEGARPDLTARDAWHQKVAGIDAGADDYLTKPFTSKSCSRECGR